MSVSLALNAIYVASYNEFANLVKLQMTVAVQNASAEPNSLEDTFYI